MYALLFTGLPPDDLKWEKNKSNAWPKLMYEDLVDYLIHAKAYDGKAMKSFRSLYGYNYVQNGWMGDMWSIKCEGMTYIKAKISPSQPGVGRKDYNSWIAVSSENTVETGHCSCPAGNARSCSHISAIIYAITLAWANGVGGETCTDKQRAWGKGAAQVLSHDTISDMVFDRPSPFQLQPCTEKTANKTNTDTDCPPRTEQFLDHSDLQDFVSNSTVANIWECKGTILYKMLHAPEVKRDINEEILHQEHCENASYPVQVPLSCAKCQTFYDKYVNISSEKIQMLAKSTENQNTCVWTDSRKLRLTSSKVNDLPKTKRANPNKFVTNQIYPRFKGCFATRHGQKYEPVARAWYESVSGHKVRKSGIVVSLTEPYIAASPDGIIDERTIVEIKCPTRPLEDLISSGKYDVLLEDGQPKLSPKGKNGYYCQVQVAMFCTESTMCKFVVWTAEKQCVVDVQYSKDFIKGILPRIRDFYFKHLLVRLTDEFQASRLKISPEYKSLCR
ncbi:uncharacterized protein LOC128235999 [Mya arenaria]|uniref:uncharacterized protein LOC128235999 n=1 Tax=Mya arenaria TaxID=6604 RepID=UPI0022E7BD8F|nr:uncharacterized protein LOC128235999 [Mya arenaria]